MKLFKPLALTLAVSVVSTSCVGNFRLFNKLAQWNHKTIDNKWLGEIIFVGLTIIPVYPICYAADAVIFNSIEFWTGDNPIKSVKMGDAGEFQLKKKASGIVSIENGQGMKLNAKLVAKNTVVFTDASGEEVKVEKLDTKFKITTNDTVKYVRPESVELAVSE